MALLRKADHTPKLVEWVSQLVKEKPNLFLQAGKEISESDFSFT